MFFWWAFHVFYNSMLEPSPLRTTLSRIDVQLKSKYLYSSGKWAWGWLILYTWWSNWIAQIEMSICQSYYPCIIFASKFKIWLHFLKVHPNFLQLLIYAPPLHFHLFFLALLKKCLFFRDFGGIKVNDGLILFNSFWNEEKSSIDNWLGLLAVRAVDDEHGTADFGGGSGDEGLIGCIVEQSVSSKIFSFSFCSFSAFPS